MHPSLAVLVALLAFGLDSASGDFVIDQRLREQQKIYPPLNPFFHSFYDKSYYYQGIQRPIYHVTWQRSAIGV